MAEVYADPLVELYCGDAREVMAALPAETVQCCITSPPYWGLRDYRIPPVIWEDGWQGSLGLEPTPEMYVEHIVEVFQVVKRVLRKDGTCWVNMGDSYASSPPGIANSRWQHGYTGEEDGFERGRRSLVVSGLKPLDLVGLPWRVAFALQADGWWLRADCIWAKPNPMPESVSGSRWERHRVKIKSYSPRAPLKQQGVSVFSFSERLATIRDFGNSALTEWEDCPGCPVCLPNDGLVLRRGSWRPTTSHEYVFMLAKSESYFADGEAVRETNTSGTLDRAKYKQGTKEHSKRLIEGCPDIYLTEIFTNGRNRRTVWEITTQPYAGAHFATFPEKLVEPCLLAGTSERGACPKCGKAWLRVLADGGIFPTREKHPKPPTSKLFDGCIGENRSTGFAYAQTIPGIPIISTLGWRPACGCGEAEAVPCLVLDCFAGSGTVGVVARRWGRKAILIELSEKYCQLAVKRLTGTQPSLREGK